MGLSHQSTASPSNFTDHCKADVDGDGSLQKEEAELMMHLIQTTIGRLERADAPFQHRGSTMVSQMFPMIDTNRDGRIGRHELVHAFVSTVARHGQGQAWRVSESVSVSACACRSELGGVHLLTNSWGVDRAAEKSSGKTIWL